MGLFVRGVGERSSDRIFTSSYGLARTSRFDVQSRHQATES